MCFIIIIIVFIIYNKTRCYIETLNLSPEQAKSGVSGEEKGQDQADSGVSSCWRPARGGGRGAAAILYYNMTYFVRQSGHYGEAIAVLCEDHLVA